MISFFIIMLLLTAIVAFAFGYSYREREQDAVANMTIAMREAEKKLIRMDLLYEAKYTAWQKREMELLQQNEDLQKAINSRAIVQHPEDFIQLSEEESVLAIDEIIYFERTRISRELHDDLIQKLVAARLTLEHASVYPMRPEVLLDFSKAMKTLESAIAGIRYYISNELQPDFAQLKLDEVIQQLCNSMDRIIGRKLSVEVRNRENEFAIAPEVLRELFRITQQALQNAITHSMGENILVFISWEENLFIQVKDDGINFIRRQKNIGSQTMSNRAKQIGAQLDFVLRSYGLVVELRLPRPPQSSILKLHQQSV